MTGKLDEISRVIGNIEAQVRALSRDMDASRSESDTRHLENKAALKSIDGRVGSLESTVQPLANAVQAMQPIVENYQITRWKLIGALLLASGILTLLGWLASAVLGKLAGALIGLLHVGRP